MLVKQIYRLYEADNPSGGSDGSDGDQAEKPTGGSDAELNKILERVSYLEGELKTAIGERDDAKGKLKQIDDEKKIQDGKLEELLAEREKSISSLTSELESSKATAEKWNKFEENRRAKIKESLGDKYKDSFDKIDLIDLEDIAKVLSDSPGNGVDTDNSTPKVKKISLTDKQKKERDIMFQNIEDEEKRTEYYIDVRKLNKEE